MARSAFDFPFYIRQSGLKPYGPGKGAIIGFDEEGQALADVEERNRRATEMGLAARYEYVSTGNAPLAVGDKDKTAA